LTGCTQMPQGATTRAAITLLAYLVFVVVAPTIGHMCCTDHDHNEEHTSCPVPLEPKAQGARSLPNAAPMTQAAPSVSSPSCCVCQHDLGDSEYEPHLLPPRKPATPVMTSMLHPGTLLSESVRAHQCDSPFSVDVCRLNQALGCSRTIVLLI